MSFDLMVFEKINPIQTYEEFLDWTATKTEWAENRDYNSLDGTSPNISAWFLDMIKIFPPMNGDYSPSDDIAYADEDSENHLTDYSIDSEMIYAAFAWSLADEAIETTLSLALKHNVGFYNPQNGKVYNADLINCIMNTEDGKEKVVVWENIFNSIQTLDSPERGTSHRNNAFITLSFQNNGTDNQFMQTAPDYPKEKNLFETLFRKKSESVLPLTFTVEAGTGDKIYVLNSLTKEKVTQIIRDYYLSHKLPDLTNWEDSGLI